MKYSKSAIGLLTAQYRSVLKKCWMINVGLFALGGALLTATPAEAQVVSVPVNVDSTVILRGSGETTYTVGSKIGEVALTGGAVKAALDASSTVVSEAAVATKDSEGHTIATYFAAKTDLDTYAKTADLTNLVTKNTPDSDWSKLLAGTTAFNKLNVGGVQMSGASGTLNVAGNISLGSEGATLTSDGANVKAANMRISNLFLGDATTAITGVDTAVTPSSGNLITSGAVATAISGASNYASATGQQDSGAIFQGATTYGAALDIAGAKITANETNIGNNSAAINKLLNGPATDNNSMNGRIKNAFADNKAATITATGDKWVSAEMAKAYIDAQDGDLEDQIDVLNSDATVTGSVAHTVEDALAAERTAGVVADGNNKLVTGDKVFDAIAAAKTDVSTFTADVNLVSANKIYNGIADESNKVNVGAALNRAGTWIEANKADITTLKGEDDVAGSVKNSVKTLANSATHGSTTIGDAIDANAQAITTLNDAATNANSVKGMIKANAKDADYATGKTIAGAIQDNTTAIEGNTTKLAGLKKSDDTTAATVQEAIDTARKGIASKALNIGEDASEVRLGKADGSAFTGLSVDNTAKAISLKSQGSTMITGMDIANNGNINLGVTSANTLHGIEISNNGNTVTFKGTGSTDVASITDGVLTAKSATLSGLKMGDNTASKISSAAAISSEGTNDTLATTSAVYNTVKAVSDTLNEYATKVDVFGDATHDANLGKDAKNASLGSTDVTGGASVNVVNDTADSASMEVRTAAGVKNTVAVSGTEIKIGHDAAGTFDGIKYSEANGVVIGSGDNTVTAKAGALTATGAIKGASVEGATLKATAATGGLMLNGKTADSIDNEGAAPTETGKSGTILASTATVYNAMVKATTDATKYTPSATLSGEGKVYHGVTTVTDGLEAAGSAIEANKTDIAANTTKLAGLTKYDGTTAAATVQEALTDFHDKSQAYTLDNIKTGAQNADYNKDTYADGTIGAAIKANADKLDGLGDASKRTMETTLPTDTTDAAIATWATDNKNIADIDTTFKVLSLKLNNVHSDLMDNGDNAFSIARALGGTAATDTLPGMVQKLAVNAPYDATATYETGSIGAAMKANDAKLAGLSKTTVQASIDDAIATASTTADGKYVAKTDLTPANGQVVLGHASTDNYNDKGTDFTVNTADSTIKATVFKPSSASDMTRKTSTMEMDKDGVTFTTAEVETSGTTTKTASIKDGVVSAEGLKLGDNDVTSIDTGAALDITTDVAAADKKVMATDATVKATVKALAEGAVKTNTARFDGFTDGQTVAQYVDANAKDATYSGSGDSKVTIAQAIANAQGAADTLRTDLATANKGNLVHGSNIIDGSITNAKLAEKSVKWANLGAGVQRRIENDEADIAANADAIATKYNFSNIVKGANEAAPTANTQVYSKVAADEAIASGVSGRILLANPDYSPEGPQYMKEVLGNLDTYGDKAVSAGAMAQFAKEIGFNMKQDQLGWDINVDTSNADSFSKKLTSTLYNNTPAAPERTVVSALNTAGDAIVKLNGDVNTDGSVLKSIKDNADSATHGDTTIGAAITANTDKLAGLVVEQGDAETVQKAIDYASAGAAEDLANVLNGTTKFTKLSMGNDWAITENPAKRFTIRDASSNEAVAVLDKAGTFSLNALSEGDEGVQSKQYFEAGNGYLKVSKDGTPVMMASAKEGENTFALYNDEGAATLNVDLASGNITSSGTLMLKDDSDASAQTLNAAKIKQITTNADNIGDMSELNARDNAMINRDADDQATTPAANIVEALNNISASVGNVHGLATAAADGSLDTKYASQQKPADWYKNGAGNLFPGSATDDHLAELAASIGNRNYAADTPYLTANESVATSLTVLANNLKGVADDYVTKAYFNNGDDTNNAISMGSGAKNITIGHTSTDDTLDNGTTLTVDNETGKITAKVFTGTDGTNPKETATLEMSKDGAKVTSGDKNVVIDEGNVIADAKVSAKNLAATDDVVVGTDGTAPYSKIEKGAATFAGTNKTVSIADGAITAGGDVTGANFVTAGDVTADGTAWAKTSLKLGAAGSEATAIDNAGTVMTAAPADGKTLASTLTVYNNIQDATTVAAAPNGNYAAGSVKDALKTVDRNMGNLSWYNGTHYANTGSTKTSLAAAIKNMDTNVFAAVGDVDLSTAINYANTTATPATNLTQAIVNMDANVKQAIDDLDDTYVTQDYFNGEDGAAGSAVIMGRSSDDIEIGKQEFNNTGDPIKLKSGIKITNGTANTIEIGNYTDDDFYGIQVSNGGKSVTVAGLNNDVTIVDGEVTAEKATVKTLAFTDGAATPTITTATSVDNTGKDVLADGVTADGEELASTLTVKNTVEGAVNVEAAANGNYAAGTVKTAVAELDAAIGKRSAYRSSHYANPANTDIDLSTAVKNLDDALFSVTEDYVTKTYFNGGDDTDHFISMGSLAKKVTIGADNSARIVLDVTDAAKKSITMTAGTDMQVAVNGTEITIGDKDGQGIKVDNDGKTTTFAGSTDAKKVVVEEGVVTASDGVIVGTDGTAPYSKIEKGAATFAGENKTVSIADGSVTIGDKLIFGGDNSYATGIDNTWGKFTAAPANNYTLATTKTVYDNTYLTAAGARGNYAAGSVLDAVKSIDTYMGDLTWYNNTHYANTGATKTSLAAAIKNMDTAIYGKLGDMDLTTATNYANTAAAADLTVTDAIKNIDTNVKAAIDDLDGKFVTKNYFNGVDEDSVTPIDISMGSKANTITIGKTSTTTVGSDTVTTLTNGVAINNTNNSVVVGRQTVDSEGVAKLQTGMNVNGENGTIDIASVNGTDNSSNGISMDKDIVKIGTTSNGKFEGITIQDGVMTNADPANADKKATFASDKVAVTDGENTASMSATTVALADADENTADLTAAGLSLEDADDNTADLSAAGLSLADADDNTADLTATGLSLADADENTADLTAAGLSLEDAEGNTADLTAASLIMDDTDNKTTVEATGVTVENTDDGTKTTVASGSIEVTDTDGTTKITGAGVETGSLKLGDSTQVATAISDGSAVADYEPGTEAEATAKATLATNATVKATVDGIVEDIEKQIHGDPDHPETPVTIGEYADNTIIGKVSTDTEKPLNTDINVDTKNNKITLETKDISTDKQTSTGIELDNKNQTIGITSANGKLGTETGLKITNEGADDQHLIELTYTHKGQDDKVDTERGLVMDADEQTYSLGSTDVKNGKFSGLDIDAAENTYTLGKGTIDDQGEFTLDYGMAMDAENGITSFADKDGNGVTMNKGDMTVTDSATVGSVDAQGVLSGVKLDKAGNAQASASATVGQVDDQGALDGNGVQLKNDGSATFASDEGDVEIADGAVTADNSVTIGDNTVDDYIDLAKQDDGSYKATFASADGNVEIAGGNVTADNKVTAKDIEAKNSIYVGDPAGEIAALYKTGLVAVKDADNQATYGSGGMWAKAGTAEGGVNATGMWAKAGTAEGGVNATGLWTQSDSKKSSYGNDGLWIGNKAETAFASLNERALYITDGTDTSNIGLDGIYTSQNISAAGNSYVGGNSQVDGVATFGKEAGKQVVIDSGDVTADGTVTGDTLVANTEFELAGTKVHSIDTGTAKVEEKGDVLATTASIFRNAEDGDYNAAEGTYTTVDAETINEALAAVDKVIGDFPNGLNYENHNLDNGGKAEPKTIVDAFNNIDATLGQIHGLAAKVGVENGSMNLGQNTTVEEHLTALAGSIGNRTSYTEQNVIKNNESTAKSLDALDMAVGDVSKLQGTTYANAGNLSDAVVQIDDKLQNLDGRVESVEHDLKDVHHELRRGMASMAAMSALVPNSRSTGKTSLSLGTGAYSGHNAVAVGGFHYLTDNLMLNAGAAWSNSRDAVYRVGVTYSF